MTVKRKGPKYDKIIDAAVSVIAEHGYHQSQISKIAREAGVADGTIYLYFKNKEDLLISLFQEKMGHFIDTTKNEIEQKHSVEDKLLTLIEMHFKQLSVDHELAIVTQLELRQTNRALRAKIGEVLMRYLDLVDEIIINGIDQKVFHPDIDIRIVRQMIFGTIDETTTSWVMNDHRYDLTALAQSVHDLLINGFRYRPS
ncbi:TetR/AcrR family transcriptional regulator [Pseudalkalibacillus berkeleyi]|uniref:TetR family transcriptional regulator n=1 Tax=Pseudalkalibacillus berkeleyi TaxID=1069813 RepID=A0ABS9GZI8_9BACL|nr:TetR/AcrR family transcriptional regulator [Pseudalkalibacillus berkeleyi]MCF6138163.1 TetR family transcriptional regulator [Pseudalkalibacillus berkeleyi]